METAIRPMIPLNDNFTVDRFPSEDKGAEEGLEDLVVDTLRGKFTFKADRGNQHLLMQSYISGFHVYEFDPINETWLSTKPDRHDMRGTFLFFPNER